MALKFEVGRRREVPTDKRRRRFLLIAVALSVAVHVVAALLIVLLPRILPNQARPQEQGMVELLMVEQKGAVPGQQGQPRDSPAASPPPAEAAAPATEAQKQASTQPPPAPPVAAPGDEPAPPTAPAPPKADAQPTAKQTEPQPPAKQADAPPAPPRLQEAPVFNLEGTDSQSNATVMGGHVLPAMKDDRFRNRPPAYPSEAQMLGQHGEVVVVIHVAENGLANGADVLQSSGFAVLDQAALTAVRKWHFRPAMREGRSIPFDMPFRFIFEAY